MVSLESRVAVKWLSVRNHLLEQPKELPRTELRVSAQELAFAIPLIMRGHRQSAGTISH